MRRFGDDPDNLQTGSKAHVNEYVRDQHGLVPVGCDERSHRIPPRRKHQLSVQVVVELGCYAKVSLFGVDVVRNADNHGGGFL